MKKVLMVVALFSAIAVSAQRDGGRSFTKDLSVEELATLKTKKMTLALALDKKQSDKVYDLVLEQVKERKEMRDARRANVEKPTLTKEQKLEKVNKRLDKRIALQNKMKTILTEDQFQEFKRMKKHDRKRGGRKGKMKSRHGRK